MNKKEKHNSFKIGDYVRNVGKGSKFYGKVGVVVVIDDYFVAVEYKGYSERGLHPFNILIKEENHFNDDLFLCK